MKSTTKSLIALGLGLGLHMSANAAIVDTWNYSVGSEWLSASAGVSVSPLTLSWGTSTGSGQSSLVIKNPLASSVETFVGGGAVPIAFAELGSTLTHSNKPITGTSLTQALLKSTLSLWVPPVSSGPANGPSPVELNILFAETPNDGDCSVPSNANGCQDVFVLTTPLQNQSFFYESQEYFVNFFPFSDTLNWLSDAACSEVGINSGTSGQRCYGFTTPEQQSTDLTFAFTVSTLPLYVPEPGSLGLAGLALLAAGLVRRRVAH